MWERTEGWEARLARLIERAPNVPFAWGTRDCCLWAADGIEALTARDPGASWRGRYDNEEAALRVLRAVLGADVHPSRYIEAMAERMASEIGATETTEAFARRGDIALLYGPLGRALGVIDLNGRYIIGVTQEGIARVPLAAGHRHWSVG